MRLYIHSFIVLTFLVLLALGFQNCARHQADNSSAPAYVSLDNDRNREFKIQSYECPTKDLCDFAIVDSERYLQGLQAKKSRGAVVQDYPAVEYDFTPNRLKVANENPETICFLLDEGRNDRFLVSCPAEVFEGSGFFIAEDRR